MRLSREKLQERICQILCADVRLVEKGRDMLLVQTPFAFSDGDPYQIYIKELPTGALRMTDCGHTFMHLSYENNIDKLKEGSRQKVLQEIFSEMDVIESDGEIYYDFHIEQLGVALFKFGQALTKVNDLTFLNRARVESTFYDDLFESITRTVSEDKIERDYVYTNMPNAEDYPIDYKIDTPRAPLFVFGVPSRDKARLVTIVLERLTRKQADFESLIIFSDQASLPRTDLARLSNVGGEMVSSLDAQEDLQRKLNHRLH